MRPLLIVAALAGALILSVSMGVRQTFGLLLEPMTLARGWGHAEFAFAIAVQNLLWGLFTPLTGALADRFGLSIGFHNCSQDDYFAMLDGYVAAYGLKIDQATLRAEATEWSVTRGSRSGRVAWQFVQELAGRLGQTLA